MEKSSKTCYPKETIHEIAKQPKQTILDSLRRMPKKESAKKTDSDKKKQITITEIDTITREEELALKVQFRLYPSRTSQR